MLLQVHVGKRKKTRLLGSLELGRESHEVPQALDSWTLFATSETFYQEILFSGDSLSTFCAQKESEGGLGSLITSITDQPTPMFLRVHTQISDGDMIKSHGAGTVEGFDTRHMRRRRKKRRRKFTPQVQALNHYENIMLAQSLGSICVNG